MNGIGPVRAGAFAAALTLLAGAVYAQATDSTKLVEAEPVLRVPAVDYRDDWVQLGIYTVLADNPQNGAKKIHAVYTEGRNVEAYLKSGAFPDGAVIVKDVWHAKTEALTTGTVSYEDTLEGRFVMVKDANGKLGSGPRFGDGWGWAFFPGDETTMTSTTNYKADCLGCHEPARQTDLTYVQGFPVLRKR
jgi:Cytochrome P460